MSVVFKDNFYKRVISAQTHNYMCLRVCVCVWWFIKMCVSVTLIHSRKQNSQHFPISTKTHWASFCTWEIYLEYTRPYQLYLKDVLLSSHNNNSFHHRLLISISVRLFFSLLQTFSFSWNHSNDYRRANRILAPANPSKWTFTPIGADEVWT